MEYFLELFLFDKVEIILLSLFFLLFLIQLFFYIKYYGRPYREAKKRLKGGDVKALKTPKVSVIISSENEAIRLAKVLPIILEQNYPDFEVIVVSDGSTDETEELLDSLKTQYNNLYSTFIPYSSDKSFGRRKLAYTMGAKAAHGDVLLFIEPHSAPMSENWIRLMVQDISDEVEVVLGVSSFIQNKTSFNRISRFDNYMFTTQYISKALGGRPFTGVYRNVAFKKSLFFENKGFASHLALENGEDLFINQIVNKSNTSVCLDQDSFTTADIDNFSLWKSIKKNHSIARSNFKTRATQIFNVEMTTRYLFYILFAGLVGYSIYMKQWAVLSIAVLLFLIRLIVQLVIINKGSEYFKSGKYYFSLLLLDIFQPIYNIRFRTRVHKIKPLR